MMEIGVIDRRGFAVDHGLSSRCANGLYSADLSGGFSDMYHRMNGK